MLSIYARALSHALALGPVAITVGQVPGCFACSRNGSATQTAADRLVAIAAKIEGECVYKLASIRLGKRTRRPASKQWRWCAGRCCCRSAPGDDAWGGRGQLSRGRTPLNSSERRMANRLSKRRGGDQVHEMIIIHRTMADSHGEIERTSGRTHARRKLLCLTLCKNSTRHSGPDCARKGGVSLDTQPQQLDSPPPPPPLLVLLLSAFSSSASQPASQPATRR
ncbi:hypothetical protein FN846DRAFT_212337 [Sphaerosporella brunnea]|uniref:Uncharacterized protein n=1 Tax=Sphaerosporella brunnea TaxID=1250544 RepID=A0A5J5EP44_9PEZI|nr:hypothetical protein FN846DRAFT_212337 [Sphaerosporella brunnea]